MIDFEKKLLSLDDVPEKLKFKKFIPEFQLVLLETKKYFIRKK